MLKYLNPEVDASYYLLMCTAVNFFNSYEHFQCTQDAFLMRMYVSPTEPIRTKNHIKMVVVLVTEDGDKILKYIKMALKHERMLTLTKRITKTFNLHRCDDE